MNGEWGSVLLLRSCSVQVLECFCCCFLLDTIFWEQCKKLLYLGIISNAQFPLTVYIFFYNNNNKFPLRRKSCPCLHSFGKGRGEEEFLEAVQSLFFSLSLQQHGNSLFLDIFFSQTLFPPPPRLRCVSTVIPFCLLTLSFINGGGGGEYFFILFMQFFVKQRVCMAAAASWSKGMEGGLRKYKPAHPPFLFLAGPRLKPKPFSIPPLLLFLLHPVAYVGLKEEEGDVHFV